MEKSTKIPKNWFLRIQLLMWILAVVMWVKYVGEKKYVGEDSNLNVCW